MPDRRRFNAMAAAAAAALAASGLPGCGFIPREAVVPMPTRRDPNGCGAAAHTLLVLLPGRGMTLRELERHGFVAEVQAQGLAVDVVRADAHLGYYKNRSILERLRADVIAPAQAAGYRSIWLAGISLGGLGALLYADAHPEDVAGLLLLAPYLGDDRTAQSVVAAGGLMRWQPPAGPPPDGDAEISIAAWRSAQGLLRGAAEGSATPMSLGYGLSDRFAATHRVLAQALPPDRVFTAPGGHDWDPWFGLWQRMLAASGLPRCGR